MHRRLDPFDGAGDRGAAPPCCSASASWCPVLRLRDRRIPVPARRRALAGIAVAGEYAAAYRILDGILLLPAAVVAAFLPSWTARRSRGSVSGGAGLVVILLICVGVLAGVELVLAREFLVGLLYGEAYGSAARILAILAISIPIFYADIALVWIAYARGKEKRVALLGVAALISNVALNIVLIPEFGGVGAAVATVVTEAVICAGYGLTLGVHRRENLARTAHLLASASACAVPMLVLATLCLVVQAPMTASCLSAAVLGVALLTIVYRRERRQLV
jgi:O-antigen/teichoic acid export membrane protein